MSAILSAADTNNTVNHQNNDNESNNNNSEMRNLLLSDVDYSSFNNSNVERFYRFDDLDLKENLLRGIFAEGLDHPTELQQEAIRPILSRRDIILIAEREYHLDTSMHIPVLQNIVEGIQQCQAIVVVPEDSVANHMFSLYSSFGEFLEIKIINLSASHSDDSVKGAQLIIGTLGGITAALARKSFSLEEVKMIILHEIDRLINNDGSNSLVEFIHEFQHPQLCITATSVNSLVVDFIEEQTRSDRIVIKRSILDRLRFDGVYQNYLEITDRFRYDALVDVLDTFRKNPCRRFWVVVYCNQARTAEFVFSKLSCDRDYKIAIVTDKTSPDKRATTMQSFNKGRGEIEVLVTSEKFGLEEIDRIYLPLSIQYQFPETEKDYIIRTARYATILGSISFTVNLISGSDEMNRLHAIMKRFQIKVNELSESILLG